jgi:cytochrome c551/c552
MKSFFIIISVLTITLINFSCSKNKSGNTNNPEIINSGTMQSINQSNEAYSNNSTYASSKYEYPDNNGIGPIKELSIDLIDQNLVLQGNKIFNMQCISCHKLDSRDVGPPLRNVTKKYTPIYIMNYLLNTTEMQKQDPLMQKLVSEYKIMMPDQQLTRDGARAILEYLRSVEN